MVLHIPCNRCGQEHEDTLGDAICYDCRKPEEFPDYMKPCPFCGGRAVLICNYKKSTNITDNDTWEDIRVYWIKCEDCESSQFNYPSEKDAITQWNKRMVD